MIKYKVKDAANDFALPNKKITEILKKHCNVDKKTMTTLTESELDVLFDVLTKEHAVKDFNAYFAVRNAKLEQAQEPVKEELSHALGRLCAVLSVEDEGFAKRLREMID